MRTFLYLMLVCFSTSLLFSQNSDQIKKQDVIKNNAVHANKDFQQKKDTVTQMFYTCPNHPDVLQSQPRKCPQCKADLVKKEVVKDIYTCPMHADVKQDKPGKCPKCKMTLEKKSLSKKGALKTT